MRVDRRLVFVLAALLLAGGGLMFYRGHRVEAPPPASPQHSRPVDVASRDAAEEAWGKGNVKAEAGDFWGAIAHYDEAIGRAPDFAELYVSRGSAYVALQEYHRAFADYFAAIERNPNLASAYYARGSLYWLVGQLDEAEQDYGKLVALRPDDAFYAGRYENVLTEEGKGAEIEDYYRRVLEGHPERLWAVRGLLNAVWNNRGSSAALNEALALRAAGFRGVETRQVIGNAYFELRNYADAVSWLRPLSEADANEVDHNELHVLAVASARLYDVAACVDARRIFLQREGRPSDFNDDAERMNCLQWQSEPSSPETPVAAMSAMETGSH